MLFKIIVMKKHISILVILFLSIQLVAAQKVDTPLSRSPQSMYCFYMGKYNAKQTVGWVLLAPGFTVAAIGGIINANLGYNVLTTGFSLSKGSKFGILGSLIALTSIPFFISAGNDRAKAFLSLKKEKLSIFERGPGKFSYPAIAIKVNF